MKIADILLETDSAPDANSPTKGNTLMQMFWQLAHRNGGFWIHENAGKQIWKLDLDENGQYKSRGGLTNPSDYYIVTCDEQGITIIQMYQSSRDSLETMWARGEPSKSRYVNPDSYGANKNNRKIRIRRN